MTNYCRSLDMFAMNSMETIMHAESCAQPKLTTPLPPQLEQSVTVHNSLEGDVLGLTAVVLAEEFHHHPLAEVHDNGCNGWFSDRVLVLPEGTTTIQATV